MKEHSMYFISIIKSLLAGQPIKTKPPDLDWLKIAYIAKMHNMLSVLYYAIIDDKTIPQELFEKIKKIHSMEVFKESQQDIESKKILELFEKNQIKSMPLKGLILKKLYPKPDMRSMSDVDILVDEKDFSKAKEIVEDMGYTQKRRSGENHDVYMKKPLMMLELHRGLVDKNNDILDYKYFGTFNRARLTNGCEFTYELSNEDYYIYMIGHMSKHFYRGGSGIRFIVDILVYLSHFENELDWDYIQQELKKCNLYKFENHMQKLSRIWFLNEENDSFSEDLTFYIISSGIYGSLENNAVHNIAVKKADVSLQHTKFKRILAVLFPNFKNIKSLYPWIRYKIFLPIGWIIRIFENLIFSRQNISKLSVAGRVDLGSVDKLRYIYKELGIKAK